ncbi:NAD-glutamate dehydrogenase [Rhizobium sp. L1K21]|uniref:NAD-glutamate dehydrogenase n=1 Tax=Rhizobium sp. L1K21 TaxID=2954933 RepID=UPI002092E9DD|nr:NAD-glutamate dehydrogenase [Rhizobium sp. L1K21]MCO6188028.1 NAD-glutamate dehydrogenase [Rhizobium sp. L1K21]
MGARRNPKRDRLLQAAKKVASASGKSFVDPSLIFSRASMDDIEVYDPEMLAAAATHAAQEIEAWNSDGTRVSITQVDEIRIGGQPCHLLSVTTKNRPFLYDSVMGEVTSTHRDLTLAVHPILVVESGKELRLYKRGEKSDPQQRISHIQIHIPTLDEREKASLEERINNVLKRVDHAVRDWPAMLKALDNAVDGLKSQTVSAKRKADHKEALAFIKWLRSDNFTFLGMREYTYSGQGKEARVERAKGPGLGILSDPDIFVLRFGKDAVATTPEILEFLDGPDYLIVTKANAKSVVHRRAYMDYIGIKLFNKNGNVAGELRIVGLFTSTAYTQPAAQIPLLRSKVAKVVQNFGYDAESHSGKALSNTLESYPRDDLFQIDVDLLSSFAEQIMELVERPRVRVLTRIDHFDRFVSVLVYVPREQYDSAVREKIGDYLKTVYEGRLSAYYPAFPEGGVARVHFIIGRSEGQTPKISQKSLENAIRDIATSWDDRFAVLMSDPDSQLKSGSEYQTAFQPEEAYADFGEIEHAATHGISIKFSRKGADEGSGLGLKIFHAEIPLSLSRRVPLLENLGFRVISERTFEVAYCTEGKEQPVILHDMELDESAAGTVDLKTQGPLLKDAFLAAFSGSTGDDTFNRLVLTAGLDDSQVNLLRAYSRYLRQAGITYSQGYIADTLNKYPDVARNLIELFIARLDPSYSENKRSKAQNLISDLIETALAGVPVLDEDRILRRYVNVICATLRTNYFQKTDDGKAKPTVVFKLDPHAVEGLPEPRPFREIFVFGEEVEGIHLRFGKVARGGLRWSDRAQDYRTEVLGLVKAQQVKNAVIVPVGAKGGFFPKKLPAGGSREEVFEAGKSAYKTFIRSLLSVTDNLHGADVVPPPETVRHDGDDPYFVVAADKGTATFSDTANALAQEADFWLDDAFASGGSAGYDHKKMGITARGAWEAVKRHFREMDIDIQSTPFTVVGVGDMSGDVFGNGMLLSRKIRLVAAFDHRDIFIDPDPEPASSFAERQRMFNLARSSWQDYDKDKLSKGGMIISRAEKSVRLTPEAAAAIGLENKAVTPFEIMTAILKADVDLLWFGGIGTYVRSTSESNAEVGDRANDPIRIVAAEVGAKVVGEGANLGMTQKARIAYGLKGGRCNSDAIDNSAGVNSSDVEVNIKIALATAMREGKLTRTRRNKLLASMTDEVAELVLRNNYLQTLAITLCSRRGMKNQRELSQLMSYLEGRNRLDRKVEDLPDAATMAERYASGLPLTRAEIGVLLSYAKIVLFDDIVASDVPDDPWFEPYLRDYFPHGMQKSYAAEIDSHRLHREIISTVLANHVINRGGPSLVASLVDSSGFQPADVVKAGIIMRDGFNLTAIWNEIDALDNVISGDIQNKLYEITRNFYKSGAAVVLKTGLCALGLKTATATLQKASAAVEKKREAILPQHTLNELLAVQSDFVEQGVPVTLAEKLAMLRALIMMPEIAMISDRTKDGFDRVAHTFLGVSENFRIGRLLNAVTSISPSDQYEEQALNQCQDQIEKARRLIVIAALEEGQSERNPLLAWHSKQTQGFSATMSKLSAVADAGELNLAKLVVAAGQLTELARGSAP